MACMPKAMSDGHDIVSKGPVDPVFLSNIKLYQKRMIAKPAQSPPQGWEGYNNLIRSWKKRLYLVQIKAKEAPMLGATNKTKVGAMCSGGVDSLYTLLGVHEIDDVIHIQNMNYPNSELSVKAIKLVRPDVKVHKVEAVDFHHNQRQSAIWLRFTHGSFLASAALLFSRYFSSMIISGTDRGPGFEIGSGHDIDYLWGSSHMRFFSYGNVSRFRKVEWLGNHPIADLIFKHMQLCSDPKQRGTVLNCSKCWKCLFTMLLIDACGLREKATAFDFTDFAANFKKNFVDWNYNDDYAFLHDMPLIMDGYERQANKIMLDLCKEYMKDQSRIQPHMRGVTSC